MQLEKLNRSDLILFLLNVGLGKGTNSLIQNQVHHQTHNY